MSRAEYIEQMYEYDQKLLDEYIEAKEKVEEKKVQLEEEQAELEARRNALLDEIKRLELDIEPCKDIVLIGVQVSDKKTGTIGTIIAQNINQITVQYETETKMYFINKKYIARPRFEDDDEIVKAFTEYDEKKAKLEALYKELEKLQ
jgi:hypothetical protein